MNKKAIAELSAAASFVLKGEEFYRKAAEKILAAQKADPPLTNAEIGKYIGEVVRGKPYDKDWVQRLVRWSTTDERASTPFGGKKETQRKAKSHAKSILRSASQEEIEAMIMELPRERQQLIAAAAGHGYLKARQEYDDAERLMSPEERRERDDASEMIVRASRLATAEFTTLGILGHLEQATDELRELNADASLTPDMARKIDRVLDAFLTEFRFARALLGEDRDE